MSNINRITFTITEVSEMLGISKKSIYSNLINKADFPAVRIGKRIVILKEDFYTWLHNNKYAI